MMMSSAVFLPRIALSLTSSELRQGVPQEEEEGNTPLSLLPIRMLQLLPKVGEMASMLMVSLLARKSGIAPKGVDGTSDMETNIRSNSMTPILCLVGRRRRNLHLVDLSPSLLPLPPSLRQLSLQLM